MRLNSHFLELKDSYLFKRIAQQVNEYKTENPDAEILRLGIGDVTRPLVPAVISAMEKAVLEMGGAATFRGYDDAGTGYGFLRSAVSKYYADKGVTVGEDEIIVSDGAKSDLGNILDIFADDSVALIPDPVYPAYVDTNVMNGSRIIYMNGSEVNGFLPTPDKSVTADVIYLCSPNNPTGAVYTKAQLQLWVDYANETGAVILFDAAYEAFVTDKSLPTSIFEIGGARTCAIEICSLSKLAGFTGVRCGYTIVPAELKSADGISLLALWKRRQTTKFNGVSYITQRGAEAVFSAAGLAQCRENIAYYLGNAKIIGDALSGLGIGYRGGENSPYIWFTVPGGDSWAYFGRLLRERNIVGTPGAGFGSNGEGYMRLTAFGSRENTEKAAARLKTQSG
ncbi:MAG: LL-diaminopimelate aminotransferase [Oscillospiraceae bacterium]|jgi:LL-diaminopimelate aminotransferase|nr:LL-diaminopimelate aminotransferase [Oscillospiraceae bacterium]